MNNDEPEWEDDLTRKINDALRGVLPPKNEPALIVNLKGGDGAWSSCEILVLKKRPIRHRIT